MKMTVLQIHVYMANASMRLPDTVVCVLCRTLELTVPYGLIRVLQTSASTMQCAFLMLLTAHSHADVRLVIQVNTAAEVVTYLTAYVCSGFKSFQLQLVLSFTLAQRNNNEQSCH